MLYDKRAVKHRTTPTTAQRALAKRLDPCVLSDQSWAEIRSDYMETVGGPLFAVQMMHMRVHYDIRHRFRGCRTAEDAWRDREGHCIELNTLLAGVYRRLRHPYSFVLTKNTKGYRCDNLKSLGIHLFLRLPGGGYADTVVGKILDDIAPLTAVTLSPLEFIAYHYADAAEDLGLGHERYDEAMQSLDIARAIDGNNYTFAVTAGNVLLQKGAYEAAEKEYTRAVRMAPEILDTYAALGDFYIAANYPKRLAIAAYETGLSRRTRDMHIVRGVCRQLKALGASKLLKRGHEVEKEMCNAPHVRKWLDVF
jgi:hypothetical protein